MKILQIAPYFPPYAGGQERFVYYLSRELVKAGHEVRVLTANVPKSKEYEVVDGIEVERYAAWIRPLRNPITPGLTLATGHLREFDIIHAHNEHSFATGVAVFLKKSLGLPLVISCHGHGQSLFGNPLADSFERLYTATLGKAILKRADKVTVATPSEREFISRLGVGKEKIALIPVGVDLATWDSYRLAETSNFISKYQLKGKKVVLVATQIIRRKGIEYLIRAMPGVVKRNPDTICLIAGGGDYYDDARQLACDLGLAEHVRFSGRLSIAELALAYKSADVFVLPSLLEGQPTCVMEAFAFSKPVVATDIEGTRDYFSDVALLVPPRNSTALTQAINEVLGDREAASELGKKGRALVESRFTWQRLGGQFASLYEDLVTGSSR